MVNFGVLVHVRHLGTADWDVLTWGDPTQNKLGDFAALAEVLLTRTSADTLVSIVLGSTDAVKDGVRHGEFTKRYALGRFDELIDFPRLKQLLSVTSADRVAGVREMFENITVAPPLRNTADEIAFAAKLFTEQGVEEVIEIAAASHAPRCAQLQSTARASGAIPPDQLWLLRAADVCYAGATPLSTVVFEPPHRADDPMLNFEPKISDVLQPYHYWLSPQSKMQLIKDIDRFIKRHRQ